MRLKSLNIIALSLFSALCLGQSLYDWEREWPDTDFTRSNIKFSEVVSGGPPKDGIPAIDNPQFELANGINDIGKNEPVIFLKSRSVVKAYPFRILMWHEIVNDDIDDIPVTVTYCPLCNAAVVFDRRLNGKLLDFGVSGKLRHSDMIMYDRQTQSWWQQFLGEAIVGEMTGAKLKRLPARVIPFGEYLQMYPDGQVLVSNHPRLRPYGENPYVKYDSTSYPFLYKGKYDGPGSPMSYVISVGEDAWLLSDIKTRQKLSYGDLQIEWQSGMSSALDDNRIADGRDIGYVNVFRNTTSGQKDVAYDMTFAFVFLAFHPNGVIHEL